MLLVLFKLTIVLFAFSQTLTLHNSALIKSRNYMLSTADKLLGIGTDKVLSSAYKTILKKKN